MEMTFRSNNRAGGHENIFGSALTVIGDSESSQDRFPELIFNKRKSGSLYGVVGYHVCLTHRRSSVQVRVQTLLLPPLCANCSFFGPWVSDVEEHDKKG